ncbi:RelA/SpoT family protein [Leucothrix pacifica]|uniref:GTP pyrophosphokinase n=1 Tax=Leucothrix pacifica TaxID=1247513 RepID=A0A317CNC8_9GAMM|nr:bifunctional (p)ppGpp synthetase/guanosine-3',5'-bis(diphosphate) 3'-pyrophosphohydrolase [Leucothrix pacifica]PWR00136.1 GTP diphosphokinase [Leucothrix pacifica]
MQHSQLSDTSQRSPEDWVSLLCISDSSEDRHTLACLIDAIQTAEQFHSRGDNPCSMHVADILHGLQVDQTTIIATLLCDVRLEAQFSLEKITEDYSDTIANLVKNVRWLQNFKPPASGEAMTEPEQAERLRRMLLAMVDDVRAVLIILAWRLEHLRTLKDTPSHERTVLARETIDIFAPLANRLGISQLKWEMEDRSFHYLEPTTYKKIAKSLDDRRIEREEYLKEFTHEFHDVLSSEGIDAKVYGRPKHIYSIWRKMQRKQLTIEQLYDLRAVRVIVDNIRQCYDILGLVHMHWKHVPEELDDYINNRKPNGYQSLHTVIIGPGGKYVEIQIRTMEMHTFAELGVAAHWRYKEGGDNDAAMEGAVSSLRKLLDNEEKNEELLEDFRSEIFPDRVFVLTPKGEILDLSKGSTPIDFAYAIHTKVGHRCQGAKVNGKIVPLNYVLGNGEQVEILTGKNERPNRKWLKSSLGYTGSSRSRNKIKHWFRQQDHGKNREDGLALLEQEQQRLGIKKIDLQELCKRFNQQSENELLIALGRGDISSTQLTDVLDDSSTHDEEVKFRRIKVKDQGKGRGIQVRGVSNLLVDTANCCKPVPGDEIIGYITMGRGITIHRTDCPNVSEDNLTPDQIMRLVEADWGEEDTSYKVDVQIHGLNQPGLLRDVAAVLAKEQVNVINIATRRGSTELTSFLTLSVQIRNVTQLSELLDKVSQLHNVFDARRHSQ